MNAKLKGWSKANLVELLAYLEHQYPKHFPQWLEEFDEIKRGN